MSPAGAAARAAALAALAALGARPAGAGRTEPWRETVWDQLMAAQARRDLRQGSRYLEDRKYDLALQEMLRAVAANPKDPLARALLGVAQYWNGLVEESLASYRESLALEPASAQTHLLLGISLAWKGDSAGAEAAFRRAAELDPKRADAQMNLGSVRESAGDMTGALERFRRAADLDEGNPLYRFQLGTLYRKLGRDAEAVEELSRAVKLEPGYEDAWLELGCAQERARDLKGARASLRRAVDLKPGDAVARFRLARLLLREGAADKARKLLAEAFRLTPEEGGAGLRLSVAYSGAGRKPGGGRGGAGARERDEPGAGAPAPEPPADDPVAVFERNLARVPLDRSARLRVDALFLPRPRLAPARAGEGDSLARALEGEALGADAAPARASRRDYALKAADAGARRAEIARIAADLRKVLAEAPPGTDARLGMDLVLGRLSDAGTRAGGGGGEDAAPSRVSYQPRDVGNDMGLWVIGTGWTSLVSEALPEAGDPPERPDSADGWTAAGLGYASLGEAQRAMESFRRAEELDGGSVPARLGRAVAAAMSGDEDGCARALREALALDPKNRAAAEGLKWLARPAAAAGAQQEESR